MIQRILELAERLDGRPVILTGCDQHAQALARHRDVLEEAALPCVARAEVVDLLVHKGHFSNWAEVHVPSFPKAVPALEFSPAGPLAFPLVAKPYHRGYSNAAELNLPSENELHDRRFTLIHSAEEWEAYRVENAAYLPHLMLQEFVRGTVADMYTVGIYADRDSEIKGALVGRKLRGFPAVYGDGVLSQTDWVPDSIMSEVVSITQALRYTGIAEFEYKRDTVTGQFHLIEINARCWSWIGLTAATDCDIPWIAYQDLTGRKVPYVECRGNAGSTKMVLLTADIANVFVRYRWDYPEGVMSPSQWWRSLKADKLVIWELDRHDWRGSIWCLVYMLYKAVRYVSRRVFDSCAGRVAPRAAHAWSACPSKPRSLSD